MRTHATVPEFAACSNKIGIWCYQNVYIMNMVAITIITKTLLRYAGRISMHVINADKKSNTNVCVSGTIYLCPSVEFPKHKPELIYRI